MASPMSVTTPASQVDVVAEVIPTIQNLGAGIVYIGDTSAVTTSTGLKLEVGGTYTPAQPTQVTGKAIWLISDGTADVRVKDGE